MPRIESPSGRRSTRERIQKSFIKLYSALFIVGGVASIFNYFQCIIPPNTPLIPAIIFRFQYYFHILTLELVQLGSYSSHQRSSAMRYFIEDASRGDLQAYNYCSKLELVNVLSFAIATFLWTAIFILIYMYLGGLDRKESGQVDFRYGSREEAMEKEMRRIESLTEEERNAEIESLKKEERESLFPTTCHFKVIAVSLEGIHLLLNKVLESNGIIDCKFQPSAQSKGGKYISYEIALELETHVVMMIIDSDLRQIDGVKMVL